MKISIVTFGCCIETIKLAVLYLSASHVKDALYLVLEGDGAKEKKHLVNERVKH